MKGLALFKLEGPARDLRRVDGREVLVTRIDVIPGRRGPDIVRIEGLRDDDGKRMALELTTRNWDALRDAVEVKKHHEAERRRRRPARGQAALPFEE